MASPFRIVTHAQRGLETTDSPSPDFKDYLGRLLKLIPGEVVGLYMIGSGFIPSDKVSVLLLWTIACFILVIVVRVIGTRDPERKKPTQTAAVVISALAFVVWIYWLGGIFEKYGLHVSYIGSLLVLLVSFVVPMFYKGDQTQ